MLPNAVFAGFFPKDTQPASPWLGNPAVREICSVSTCISPAPEGWIDHWLHNALGFFDTADLARQVAGEDPARFDLYAYRIVPVRCREGVVEPFAVPEGVGDVPDDFAFLGYDIVTRSTADFFECSPLSCNAGAREYPVNPYCLVDDAAQALETLRSICAGGGYEPGPYYLFEVYRQPNAG